MCVWEAGRERGDRGTEGQREASRVCASTSEARGGGQIPRAGVTGCREHPGTGAELNLGPLEKHQVLWVLSPTPNNFSMWNVCVCYISVASFVEKTSCLHSIVLFPLSGMSWLYTCVDLILGSLFCSSDSFVHFSSICYSTMLCPEVHSGSPLTLISLNTAFSTLGPFPFHVNFRINWSIAAK